MNLKRLFSTAPIFYTMCLLLWIVGVFLILTTNKTDFHLLLNSFHSSFLDVLFQIITLFGDGIFVLVAALILLFNNFRRAIVTALSALLAGLFTQFLKRIVFSDSLRPTAFFEDPTVLPLVEGMSVARLHSFPSGHTTTAFAIACCFALFYPRGKYQVYFFVIATLVAYSRIYLSLHFLEDVLVGSLIGVVVASVVSALFDKAQAPWLQRALFKGRVMVE